MALDSLGNIVSEHVRLENNFGLISFDFTYPTEIRIEHSLIDDHLRLFVLPGDSLGISIKKDTLPNSFSFEISGNSSSFQKYLYDKDKEYRRVRSELWMTTWKELPDMLAEWDQNLSTKRDTLNFDSELLRYDSLVDLSRVMTLHLTKFISTSSLDTSRIHDLFAKLQQYDPGLKRSFDFNFFVYNLQTLFITLNQWQNEHLIEQDLQALTAERLRNLQVHPFIRSWMTAILLSQVLEYGIDGDLGDLYQRYINSTEHPNVFIEALKKRAELWEQISRGFDAPDFEMITSSGDTISLSDYFGKYIYIDLWASWCKPCIYEFPHSLTTMLDQRFHDFNFIFINMDASQEVWKNSMERFEIPDGIHTYVPGEWENAFFKKYNQTALPRYLIINPEGKIINAHAPRPSQREKIWDNIQESTL